MRAMVVTHDQRRRREVGEFLRQRGYEVQVPPSRREVVPQARAIVIPRRSKARFAPARAGTTDRGGLGSAPADLIGCTLT